MKATELITQLQALVAEHGDLIVADDGLYEINFAYFDSGWDLGSGVVDVFFISPEPKEE